MLRILYTRYNAALWLPTVDETYFLVRRSLLVLTDTLFEPHYLKFTITARIPFIISIVVQAIVRVIVLFSKIHSNDDFSVYYHKE